MALKFGGGPEYKDWSQVQMGGLLRAASPLNGDSPLEGTATDMYRQNVANSNSNLSDKDGSRQRWSAGMIGDAWNKMKGFGKQLGGFLPGTNSTNLLQGFQTNKLAQQGNYAQPAFQFKSPTLGGGGFKSPFSI